MTGQHAPLAPSSAPQWGRCSGFILANADAPDLETEDSRRGDAAHWLGATALESTRDHLKAIDPFALVGTATPNGVIIDDEIAAGAEVYVDDVLNTVVTYHNDAHVLPRLLVEHRVEAPQIHPQNWGTLDSALPMFNRNGGVIHLWDYKNGHRENSAVENLQLINYAAGLVNKYQIDGLLDQHIEIVFRIVQPFCYRARGPISEWRVKLSDLRGYFNQLSAKAHEAFNNPMLTTGEHCRDCRAVTRCPARRKADYNFIDYADMPYSMDTMSLPDLATERRILEKGLTVGRARLEAIEDELKTRITDGGTGSGLALEASYGREVWTVPKAQAIAIAAQFGADISKPDVMTPTQARQAVPRPVRDQFAQVIKSFTKRPASGLKLTDAGDTVAARAFTPTRR